MNTFLFYGGGGGGLVTSSDITEQSFTGLLRGYYQLTGLCVFVSTIGSLGQCEYQYLARILTPYLWTLNISQRTLGLGSLRGIKFSQDLLRLVFQL